MDIVNRLSVYNCIYSVLCKKLSVSGYIDYSNDDFGMVHKLSDDKISRVANKVTIFCIDTYYYTKRLGELSGLKIDKDVLEFLIQNTKVIEEDIKSCLELITKTNESFGTTAQKGVLQDWVTELPLMQQSVLISNVRGPDGIKKYHPCKDVIKWFRRTILISAFDGKALDNPGDPGGGSFTGPSINQEDIANWENAMSEKLDDFLVTRDELPHHYITHFIHAIQIVGYKHPNKRIRAWWVEVYKRMVNSLHLHPETEYDMDRRLCDSFDNWMDRADKSEKLVSVDNSVKEDKR